MPSVLERAAAGNRSAMHRVYEKERRLFWFLCLRLSENEREAAELFCAALEKLWADVQPRDAASPEAFRRREARTLFSCLPPEPARDEPPESLWSLSVPADSSASDILLAVADRLPRTQRFLFLLRFAAGFSEQDAAFAAGGDTSAAEGLCRKAEQTVKRQLSLLRFKVGLPDAPEAREIGPLLREAAAEISVPDELDAEAAAIILRAARPAKLNPVAIAALVCLFLAAALWFAWALSSPDGTEAVPSETVSGEVLSESEDEDAESAEAASDASEDAQEDAESAA